MGRIQRPYEWYRNMYGVFALIVGVVMIGAILIGWRSVQSTVSKVVPTPTIEPTTTPISLINPKKTPSNFPTQMKKNPMKPTPTNKIQPDSSSSFQYPGSIQAGELGNATFYTTTDSPDMVTNWYKTKIKEQGMNTTSFIQNSVNGNVSNLLVGTNGREEIRIEIKKQAGNNTVQISISN